MSLGLEGVEVEDHGKYEIPCRAQRTRREGLIERIPLTVSIYMKGRTGIASKKHY